MLATWMRSAGFSVAEERVRRLTEEMAALVEA
jgi:hypothetical protein